MAFGDPIQWVVIAIVVVALLVWGPSKIPELAKGIGSARKEFQKAQETENLPAAVPQATQPVQSSSDEVLIQTAKKLGIATEGKTREQLAREIVAAAS